MQGQDICRSAKALILIVAAMLIHLSIPNVLVKSSEHVPACVTRLLVVPLGVLMGLLHAATKSNLLPLRLHMSAPDNNRLRPILNMR